MLRNKKSLLRIRFSLFSSSFLSFARARETNKNTETNEDYVGIVSCFFLFCTLPSSFSRFFTLFPLFPLSLCPFLSLSLSLPISLLYFPPPLSASQKSASLLPSFSCEEAAGAGAAAGAAAAGATGASATAAVVAAAFASASASSDGFALEPPPPPPSFAQSASSPRGFLTGTLGAT